MAQSVYEPLILVDLFTDVVQSMQVEGIDYINYEPGRSSQILENLSKSDYSNSFKDKKYPLIALLMPVDIEWGDYYGKARIQRVVFGALTNTTDTVLERYKVGGTFKSILYPCFSEFLIKLAQHPNVVTKDPQAIRFTQRDNPGAQPIGDTSRDFIDTIEILNLEITLSKTQTCK